MTVALNGDGGDENFAGYDRYRAVAMAKRLDRVPAVLRRAIAGAVNALPRGATRSPLGRARRFAEAMQLPAERRYCRWVMHFTPDMKAWLCTPAFREAAGARDPDELLLERYRTSDAPEIVDATLDVDLHTYLPDDLLVKVDIATMAHGLEARSPLLDYELMEFAASLPAKLKLHGGVKKYILKKAMEPFVPSAILSRPKMGFGVPIEQWFRNELRAFAADLLLGKRATERGYFRRDAVERILAEHAAGTRAWHYQIWNLVMLEMWHQQVMEAVAPRPAADAMPAVRVG